MDIIIAQDIPVNYSWIFTYNSTNNTVNYAHMSTIEVIYNYNDNNNTLLISAWQQGSGEGSSDQHIAMSVSYDYGITWSKEITIIKDDMYPIWGPSLYYNYFTKTLYCFYSKSGAFNLRSTNRYYPGGDILYKTSNNYGVTWSNYTLIWKFYGTQYNISKVTANKPISISIGNNNEERWILPIWQEYRTSNMTGNYASRNLISDDFGKTWNIYGYIQCGEYDHGQIPTYCIEPAVAYIGNNTILGFYRAEDGFIYQSFSYNNGIDWIKAEGNHQIFNSDSKIFVFTICNDSKSYQILAHNPIPNRRTPLTLMSNINNGNWSEYVILDDDFEAHNEKAQLSYPTSVEVLKDNNTFIYTSYSYGGQGIRLAFVQLN